MKLSTLFTRLAAGIALSAALTTSVQAALPPDVSPIPPGVVPSFMQTFYTKSVANADANKKLDYTKRRLTQSIRDNAPTPPNDFINTLIAQSPDVAEEIARACGIDLCHDQLSNLDEKQKLVAKIIIIEALIHNGLNADEFKQYADFIINFIPDQAFIDDENEKLDKAMTAIVNEAAASGFSERLVPIDDLTPENMTEQYYLRLNFMQMAYDRLADSFGHPHITVVLDKFPSGLDRFSAVNLPRGYDPGIPKTGAIALNFIPYTVDSAESMIRSMSHEFRHNVDNRLADELKRKAIPYEDVRFMHASVIALNKMAYGVLCGGVKNPEKDCADSFNYYAAQYMERAAYDIAERAKAMMREKEPQPIPSGPALPADGYSPLRPTS